MKAFVLHNINEFALEDVAKPLPADNEVLVAVKAAGICGSDIPRVYKTGTYSYPLIHGHEFSGVVESVGANVDANWSGKRVGVFPLIPCKKCGPCKKKQYEMCRSYSYLGSRRDGGFAEYVSVPVDNLVELPEKVSFEEAAMLEPMAVAVHAMRKMNPRPSDTVAVCGLGTIGLLLVMFLKEAGIENILLVGNKEFQQQAVLRLGISEANYCDCKKQNPEKWISTKTNGAGVDIFFECVGKNETVLQAINATIPGGKVMLVGNPASDMCLEKSVYWKVLRNQLEIKGTWNSSFCFPEDEAVEDDDWRYVLQKLEEGRIHPAELITHRFPMEELEQGFHIMRDKSEDYVKVMGVHNRYEEISFTEQEKKEGVRMCKVLDAREERGIKQGIKQGTLQILDLFRILSEQGTVLKRRF